jgi:hypothetical protein
MLSALLGPPEIPDVSLSDQPPRGDTGAGLLSRVLGKEAQDSEYTIPGEFKGMQAAVASTSAAGLSSATALGCHTTGLLSNCPPARFVPLVVPAPSVYSGS